jgi:hypothetical protein
MKVEISQFQKDYIPEVAGLVALAHGRVVGYLCWFLVDHFRETERRGAYVPEWGHGCVDGNKEKIIQLLYRAAGEIWAAAGCQVHAITLLTTDHSAENAWFWN